MAQKMGKSLAGSKVLQSSVSERQKKSKLGRFIFRRHRQRAYNRAFVIP
jgi:hypothetical protein